MCIDHERSYAEKVAIKCGACGSEVVKVADKAVLSPIDVSRAELEDCLWLMMK